MKLKRYTIFSKNNLAVTSVNSSAFLTKQGSFQSFVSLSIYIKTPLYPISSGKDILKPIFLKEKLSKGISKDANPLGANEICLFYAKNVEPANKPLYIHTRPLHSLWK